VPQDLRAFIRLEQQAMAMTDGELAQRIGWGRPKVCAWLNGKTDSIDIGRLSAMLAAVGLIVVEAASLRDLGGMVPGSAYRPKPKKSQNLS